MIISGGLWSVRDAYYVLIVLRKPNYKPKGIVLQTVLTGFFFHKHISCHFCIAARFSDFLTFLLPYQKLANLIRNLIWLVVDCVKNRNEADLTKNMGKSIDSPREKKNYFTMFLNLFCFHCDPHVSTLTPFSAIFWHF